MTLQTVIIKVFLYELYVYINIQNHTIHKQTKKCVYQKLSLVRKKHLAQEESMISLNLNIGTYVRTFYLLSRQKHFHFSGWGGEVNNPVGTMLQTGILIKWQTTRESWSSKDKCLSMNVTCEKRMGV